LNVYGRSKAEAELRVLDIDPDALVIRTAAFFSPHDVHNFAVHSLEALRAGRRFAAADDNHVSPTYVPDLVDATLDLMLDREAGIRHLASDGRLSWAGFARALADAAGLDPDQVDPIRAATWAGPRHVPPTRRSRPSVASSCQLSMTRSPASCATIPLPPTAGQGVDRVRLMPTRRSNSASGLP
jgi:dTDP-4-dehydrorhamnose reductase